MPSDWVVVQPSLKPLTDKIEPILAPVLSVIDLTIQILNITQSILNIIKAFLIGVLDPLRPIVEAIIAEIQALISDLRQAGFYLHGDWNLFDWNTYYSDLLGGYEEYQNRMIGRLLDASDPTRPNFSPQSATLGLFLYATSGDVGVLIAIIKQLVDFFGQKGLMGDASPFPPPQNPSVLYSSENWLGKPIFVESGKLSARPEKISVTWTYPSGAGIPFLNGPAPKSYLIHVSTIPDGFSVVAMQPKDDTAKKTEGLQTIVGVVIDPITNKPLKVYGGTSDLGPFINLENAQAPKLYLSINPNEPLIDPVLLDQDGVKVFGKSFIVGTGFFDKMAAGSPITAHINASELPMTGDIVNVAGKAVIENIRTSDVYYIRVRGTTYESDASLREPKESSVIIYQVGKEEIRLARMGTVIAKVENPKAFTKASAGTEAKIPSEKTISYQKAVQTAIAILILSRSDFSKRPYDPGFARNTYADGGETGLESIGRPLLQTYNIGSSLYRSNNPKNFRNAVLNLSKRIQSELQNISAPPDTVLDAIQAEIDILTKTILVPDFFGKGPTLLEALESTTEGQGIGANPLCQDLSKKVIKQKYQVDYSSGPERGPSYYTKGPEIDKASWVMGSGSGDYSPILYNNADSNRPVFIRNWLVEQKTLLASAKTILGIANVRKNPKDGSWISVRLLPNFAPGGEAILDKLESFLEGILDSLEGIADKIIAIIESIQARIYQLQAILEYIKALLGSLTSASLPGIAGLVLVANGTAGLAGELISSGNKPISSATDYSAGVVVVAGGLPAIVLDLLYSIFGGE